MAITDESNGPGIFTDLVFNAFTEWLSPAEYDGKALLALPTNDARLRTPALLAWEVHNTCSRSAAALAPVRAFFIGVSARDKAGRFVQYLCRLFQGILTVMGGGESHH